MQYRLTLDNPTKQAIELGTRKAVHHSDFRPNPAHVPQDGVPTTWRCPITGVVMLNPSFNTADWYKNLVQPKDLTFSADFWRAVKSADGNFKAPGEDDGGSGSGPMMMAAVPAEQAANMLTSVRKQGKGFPLIEIEIKTAIIAIGNAAKFEQNYDNLKWAIQSKFNLAPDEGFAVHYYGLASEDLRRNNWFAVSWDDIYVHFSHQGLVRVYKYRDRTDLKTGGFDLTEQFYIGEGGDFLNKEGYFIFLPMPGIGLCLYHYAISSVGNLVQANAGAGSVRGHHLIKWDSHPVSAGAKDGSTLDRLFEASPIKIAVNPYHHHKMGIQRLIFPLSGDYVDSPLDPGYQPSTAPDSVVGLCLNTVQQKVTAALLKPDLSAPWAAGTDRQGAVKLTLTTTDNRYTPFVRGYGAAWNPVFVDREPTPLTLSSTSTSYPNLTDKLIRLEFSEDEYGKWEGSAEMLLSTLLAHQIAERGDATFLLEGSEDGGQTWDDINGGFAKDWNLEAAYLDGVFLWRAHCKLIDFHERLRETHNLLRSAFDGLSVGEAVNVLLTCSGFSPIDPLPPETLQKKIQGAQNGQSWRLAPREGDDDEDILWQILLYLRSQGVEWRARFDWAKAKADPNNTAGGWMLDQKPHDASQPWYLMPFSNLKDPISRIWPYSTLHLAPEPPEANTVKVVGFDTNDSSGSRIESKPQTYAPSVSDSFDPDYLGRTVYLEQHVFQCSSQKEVDEWARRVFDAVVHRRLKGTAECAEWQPLIKPNTALIIAKDANRALSQLWVKRITVVVEKVDSYSLDMIETASIEFDSVWEGELRPV